MATVVQEKSMLGSAPVTGASAPKQKRSIVPYVLGIAILAAVIFGGRYWWLNRDRVKSDNAQVEGHITPILPRVGGFVLDVRVADNTQVKLGDTLVVLDDRDLRARLAQSDAELNVLLASVGTSGRIGQAMAQVSAARAGAAAADASITQAQANAERAT